MSKEELVQRFLQQSSGALVYAPGPCGNHFIFKCSKENGDFLKEFFEERNVNKVSDEYEFGGNWIVIEDSEVCDRILEFNFERYEKISW